LVRAQIRAADISFTLTKLGQLTQKGPLFHDLPATRIDLTKVIAMGHSLGGAAAALAVRQDERIRGGIDLDGRLFSPVLESGLVGGGPNNKDKDKNKNKNKNKPFMLLGREKHADEDPTWNQFWRVLRGTSGGQGAMVAVKGTSHFSFADLPPLIQALGLPDEVKGQVEAMLGVVDGARMQRILAEVLASFFKWAFEGSHGPFEEVVGGFEEAVIRNSTFLAV
jgi:predicted dienelactone hydrolase